MRSTLAFVVGAPLGALHGFLEALHDVTGLGAFDVARRVVLDAWVVVVDGVMGVGGP